MKYETRVGLTVICDNCGERDLESWLDVRAKRSTEDEYVSSLQFCSRACLKAYADKSIRFEIVSR
jgi:hypothetical protein